ncbi:hypothetical protein Lesp02_31930 [Lentzea sp. NBRC 105346]|uniref:hypothetical protein n=1 Tax=Lentzea sp. NBRC 105346 TaxID=3032205 RepID=UPI0024A21081|nr:hypothetical protein [Lentzea sp. NBRC 105346]GLZ31004.1 hypothetical protein Lesp02_31930 [Lentzea sp. NBRC 105346]
MSGLLLRPDWNVVPSLRPWVERLAPHLDGTRSLTDLTADLESPQREHVERLLSALLRQGVVREITDLPHGLSADELAEFAPEIELAGSPHAFEKWRRGRTFVVGEGRLATAVARALRQSGVRHVDIVGLISLVRGADLVLHVADRPMVDRAHRLDRAHEGVWHAMITGGAAWLADCADPWTRLGDQAPRTVSAVAVTVAANQFVQHIFRVVTGAVPLSRKAIRVDLDGLWTTEHGFLRSGAPRDRIEQLTDEEFSRRIAPLVDEWLGVLHELDEHDFTQSPLHVTRARVGDEHVVGSALDFARARYDAALRGLELYAARREGVPAFAGYSWKESVTAGLVARCRTLTVAEPPGLFPAVDPATLPEAGPYVTLLKATGLPLEVYDVTGSLGVPTFACCLDGRTVAYGCGVTAAEALRDGLHDTLLSYQATKNGEPYAPPPVPDLPPAARGPVQPVRTRAVHDARTLIKALEGQGHHVSVEALDAGLHEVMPFLVTVVIT